MDPCGGYPSRRRRSATAASRRAQSRIASSTSSAADAGGGEANRRRSFARASPPAASTCSITSSTIARCQASSIASSSAAAIVEVRGRSRPWSRPAPGPAARSGRRPGRRRPALAAPGRSTRCGAFGSAGAIVYLYRQSGTALTNPRKMLPSLNTYITVWMEDPGGDIDMTAGTDSLPDDPQVAALGRVRQVPLPSAARGAQHAPPRRLRGRLRDLRVPGEPHRPHPVGTHGIPAPAGRTGPPRAGQRPPLRRHGGKLTAGRSWLRNNCEIAAGTSLATAWPSGSTHSIAPAARCSPQSASSIWSVLSGCRASCRKRATRSRRSRSGRKRGRASQVGRRQYGSKSIAVRAGALARRGQTPSLRPAAFRTAD